jgi:hypothetical protein
MNFQTGNFHSYGSGLAQPWTGLNGGAFTATGVVDLSHYGILDTGEASGALAGVFGGSQPTGSSNVATATLSTFIDPALLQAFYDTPRQNAYAGNVNIPVFASTVRGAPFTTTLMGSGDVLASTPEPVSIILMGTTVLGCTWVGRRYLVKAG